MTETATGRSRPYAPRMAPSDRREQLLDAALQIIVRDGIHKVSIDTVAREARVTRPVVYGVFADTNALLRASLDREERAILAQLAQIVPTPGEGRPADAALAFLDGFLRAVLAAPDRWRAVFALVDSTTPAYRKRVERGRQMLIGVFEQLVRWAAADGLDPRTDVEMLARALYALVWDAGRTVLAEPKDFPPDRVLAFARATLARFLPVSS